MDNHILSLGFFPWGFGSQGIYYMRNIDRVARTIGDGFMKSEVFDEIENPIYLVRKGQNITFRQNDKEIGCCEYKDLAAYLHKMYGQ